MAAKRATRSPKKSSKKKPAAKKGGPKVGKPGGGTVKLPSASAIGALAKRLEACAKDSASASKAKTELMAAAFADENIDKWAMGIGMQLKRLKNANTLAIRLAQLPYIIEKLGLEDIATKQGDMVGRNPASDAKNGKMSEEGARPGFASAGDKHIEEMKKAAGLSPQPNGGEAAPKAH